MLVGQELLEKLKLLSKKSEEEIARGCGYIGPSGRVLRKSFYRAYVEAKYGRSSKKLALEDQVIDHLEEGKQNSKPRFMETVIY